jgi:tetratricopeptide (TPR) repeat protein
MPNLSRMQRQAHHSFQRGEFDKTARLCTGILEHRPQDFDALHLLGLLSYQCDRMVEALHFLSAALKVNAGSSDAMANLGMALDASGRHDEAISSFRHALQLAPDHPEILFNLGNVYLKLGRIAEAVASYDAVLANEPTHVGTLVNRGNALLRLNRPDEALASYDNALTLLPGHPQILTNRGHTHRRLDRPLAALADFDAALAAAPQFAEAHFEAGMTHLSLGDFAVGWKEYEWRWNTEAFAGHRRQYPAPRWRGEPAISGKTILLHAEQGFGDTIQFIRYAQLLARRGANVVCEVQPELQPLLSQLADVEIIVRGAPLPAFDLHCPLLSLPLAFGTQPETIPADVPYLAAPPERLEYWRERLPAGPRRVGFVWSGSPSHKNDSSRSIPLARLAACFAKMPIQCVSLQSELRAADREVLQHLPDLVHLGDLVRDFADSAAIVALLDVVVSVDTAAAHLAGAIGRPVVILLPHAADFRWMRGRQDSAWYPTAKLLRQPAFGDWDSVIARLPNEVTALTFAGAFRSRP